MSTESKFFCERVEAEATVVDPFYLYLDLVERLGVGQVFLLDAAKDASHPDCQMSLIGLMPVLDVCVKDGATVIYASQGLDTYLERQLRDRGRIIIRCNSTSERSVVSSVQYVSDENPLELLEELRIILGKLVNAASTVPYSRGFLGYIGYDAAHYLERLPKSTVDDRELPDIRLQWHPVVLQLRAGQVSVFSDEDALRDVLDVTEHVRLITCEEIARNVIEARRNNDTIPKVLAEPFSPTQASRTIRENVSSSEFQAAVRKAKDYIRAGDVFQLVLSKRIEVSKRIHHYKAYNRLRELSPSPYMFFAEYPEIRIFGASPEVQLRSLHRLTQMRPIAGTSKGRGKTFDDDRRLMEQLMNDEKERAEHLMLVDLCRNDLGRVCEYGSIRVSEFMVVEPYSHLFHLVSTVEGRLRPDASVFEALVKTFPAGTLSGAPKIRAMEIIDELETHRRGPYGGLIGMIDFASNANTAIVIRTVIEVNERYYVQVGAGIVADSDEMQEWLECGHKSKAIMEVLTQD